MEKEPTLFDFEASTPQAVLDDKQSDAQILARIEEYLRIIEDLREKTGVYKLLPPAELIPRIKAHFDNTIGSIASALSGVSEDTRNAVLYDYTITLFGGNEYTATLEQMREAVRAVKGAKAFIIDRYGFYWFLMQYTRTLTVCEEYRRNMIDTDARKIPVEVKNSYLRRSRFNPAQYFQAFEYLKNNGISTPLDFAGCDTANVRTFLEYAQEAADIAAYGSFYMLARSVYSGTAEELAAIVPPPTFEHTQTTAVQWGERFYTETKEQINEIAIKYAELIEAETLAEREKIKANVEAAEGQIWALNENFLNINSRTVNITPDGDLSNVFPVQSYINSFLKKFPDYTVNGKSIITPMVVQQVFEAINLLSAYGRIDTVNGRYHVDTSIEELSQIVGYADANSTEKKALYGGLMLFNDLYVVLEKPIRTKKVIGKNGKERRIRVGGPTAISVLHVEQFGLTGAGELKLSISPEALKGKPVYITEKTYQQMRKKAKGASQSRFNAQLLTKGHKDENDLAAEVFGYEGMKRNAELIKDPDERDAELKRVKTYIQNHRSDDKKKIAKWFEQYAADGILTYERLKAKTGKGYYYKWTVIRPEGLGVSEASEEPDEQ